jgi:hypothetical protein
MARIDEFGEIHRDEGPEPGRINQHGEIVRNDGPAVPRREQREESDGGPFRSRVRRRSPEVLILPGGEVVDPSKIRVVKPRWFREEENASPPPPPHPGGLRARLRKALVPGIVWLILAILALLPSLMWLVR